MQSAPKSSSGKIALAAIAVVGIVVVIAVVATRGKTNHDDVNKWWLDEVATAHDKICACKDDACVRDAMADLEKVHKTIGDGLKLSREQSDQAAVVLELTRKCVDRVPGTDVAPSGGDDNDTMLAQVSDLRDRMCACKDDACGRRVINQAQVWLKKYQPGIDKRPKDVRDKAMAAAEELKKCYDNVGK